MKLHGNNIAMNSETKNAWAAESVEELIAAGIMPPSARSLLIKVLLLAFEKGRSTGLDEAKQIMFGGQAA